MSEQSEARAIADRERRDRWLQRRWCQRLLLARYGECLPAEVTLSVSESGKPVVDNPPGIHFSPASTDTMGGVAIHQSPIGFDLERIDWTLVGDELRQQSEFVLSPRELRLIFAAQGEDVQRLYYRRWVLKEAFLKATGTGISGVVLPEVDPFRPDESGAAEISLEGSWRAFVLEPNADHVAALVAQHSTSPPSLHLLEP